MLRPPPACTSLRDAGRQGREGAAAPGPRRRPRLAGCCSPARARLPVPRRPRPLSRSASDQRWPHAIAIARPRSSPGRAAASPSSPASRCWPAPPSPLYHAGIEQAWWQGPTTCTAPDPGAVPPGQLLDRILETPGRALRRLSPGPGSASRWPAGTPSSGSALALLCVPRRARNRRTRPLYGRTSGVAVPNPHPPGGRVAAADIQLVLKLAAARDEPDPVTEPAVRCG